MIFYRYCLVFLLFILVGCKPSQPPVILHDLQGQAINLTDYRGKWVLINYWASWCKPCWEEIPELNAFYEANKDKVLIVGANIDDPAEQLSSLAKKMNIRFPVLKSDPGPVLGLSVPSIIPATFIIQPDGTVRSEALLGAQTRQSLEDAMR